MNYSDFLEVFSLAGGSLLVGLLTWDTLASLRSATEIAALKRAAAKMKEVGEEAKSEVDARRDFLEGPSLEGITTDEILRKVRRTVRSATEGKEVPTSDLNNLGRYVQVVKRMRDTADKEKLEDQRFPVRAYAKADANTKNGLREVMITLRSLRELEKVSEEPF